MVDCIYAEDSPSKQRNHSVYHSVMAEPGEPIRSVSHSHHAHRFAPTVFFLLNKQENIVVKRCNKDHDQGEWQKELQEVTENVRQTLECGWLWDQNGRNASTLDTGSFLKNNVCNKILKVSIATSRSILDIIGYLIHCLCGLISIRLLAWDCLSHTCRTVILEIKFRLKIRFTVLDDLISETDPG